MAVHDTKSLWDGYQKALLNAHHHLAKPIGVRSTLRKEVLNSTVYDKHNVYSPIGEDDVAENPAAVLRFINAYQ